MPEPTRNPHKALREALTNPKAFGTTLLVILLDTYDNDALYWHPDTIKQSLEEDYQVKLPAANYARLMAAVTLLTTNRFTRFEEDFVRLCNILSGDTEGDGQFDPADLLEIAWGLTEWYLLVGAGEEDPDDEFAPAIVALIAKQCMEEGLVDPPDVLRIAVSQLPVNTISEFQDDPEMYAAIYQSQKEKKVDIEQAVRASLAGLFDQLNRLPLTNGTTQALRQELVNDQRTDSRGANRTALA